MLLGVGMLGAAWFFPTSGAALLGFLLKKNTIVETGPTGPLIGGQSAASAIGGWAGLVGAAVLGLIVVGMISSLKESHRSAADAGAGLGTSLHPGGIDKGWVLVESTNKMDSTPEVVLRRSSENNDATLTIRCIERKTEAYVDTDKVVENGTVRIKFDQSAPSRQGWHRSTDYKALFAPDPVALARALLNSNRLLKNYS